MTAWDLSKPVSFRVSHIPTFFKTSRQSLILFNWQFQRKVKRPVQLVYGDNIFSGNIHLKYVCLSCFFLGISGKRNCSEIYMALNRLYVFFMEILEGFSVGWPHLTNLLAQLIHHSLVSMKV